MRKTCAQTVERQWLWYAVEHNLCTQARPNVCFFRPESRERAQLTTSLPTAFPQPTSLNLPLFSAYFSSLSTGPITTTTNILINS